MKNNWLRLLVFFILLVIFYAIAYVPVAMVFPEVMWRSKEEYTALMDNNLVFRLLSQALFTGATFVTVYVMVRHIEEKDGKDLRLSWRLKEIGRGFGIGVVILAAYVAGMLLAGAKLSFQGLSGELLISLVFYWLVSVNEEVVVRGYVLANLSEKFKPLVAVAFSSLLFGALHYFNNYFSWLGLVNISLSGFLMGLLMIQSQTISTPIGLHWAWNFMQGPVAGVAVSGNPERGIFHLQTSAPASISGGAFGAEGSLILLPITVAAILFFYVKGKRLEERSETFKK
jgi:membrane protease YdiL (CAAX protease family)